jgi:hypothetical protein
MTKSEQLLSAFSEDYFFKELVLDDLWFTPPGSTKVELADLVINLCDIVVAIQLKERNEEDKTGDPKEEKKWFDDRCKSAKKQVKKTLQYISAGVLPAFVNKRGQSVLLQSDATVIPLVVFENSQMSDYPPLLRKHSESGMNINCMSLADYREMCRVLVTPMEIVEYLKYRKAIYENHGDLDIMILERTDNEIVLTKPRKNETLVHQFLIEKYEVKEIADQRLCIQFFRNFLHLLPERTVNCSSADGTYNVLTFLAHLQRYEIATFWDGFEATKTEAKQGEFGIRHSLRHEISGYVIVFTANGMIPIDVLLPIIRKKTNPVRVLEIEIHWFDDDAFGIDFLYWDDSK